MAFRTREQIEAGRPAAEAREREAAIADHAKRTEMSRKRVVITLEREPKERFVGDKGVVSFEGSETGRSPLSAVYFKSELDRPSTSQEGAEDLDARMRDLERGDKVTLAGYWAKRQWKAADGSQKDAWEFKAQAFEKGDVSLADVAKAALARIDAIRPAVEGIEGAQSRQVDAAIEPDRSPAPSASGGKPRASANLVYSTGNIVDDKAQVLVNTVNSQLSEYGNPVMGKGVAKDFKDRFPTIMKPYGDAINSGELTPGRTLLFDLPDGRKWAALASKDHFSQPSRIEWVDAALKELGDKVVAAGLSSIALPPPGCGNGKLDWKDVEPLVHKHVADRGIKVSMYARPSGAMQPALLVDGPAQTRDAPAPVRQPSPVDAAKAKSLAAFGNDLPGSGDLAGSPARSGPKVWTEAEIVKAIPALLAGADGYKAYSGIGSRETPQEVADEMTAVARTLEGRGLTMRSGGADKSKGVQPPNTKSADLAFEEGISDRRMKEIFIPWKGFGKFDDGVLMDPSVEPRARKIAMEAHPKWVNCSPGAQKMHIRNVSQVYGAKLDSPVAFAMCWTKNGAITHDGPDGTNPDDGGTGQAIRIAGRNGIPVLNLQRPAIRAAVMKELGIGPDLGRAQAVETSRAAPAREAPAREQGSSPQFDLRAPAARFIPAENAAAFSKVKEENGVYSNMHNQSGYTDNGIHWKSTEAQYQAARFPHRPDIQKMIRDESNAYTAKTKAYEFISESRPDWNDDLPGGGKVKDQMMAYVLSRKMDSPEFARHAEDNRDRQVVEISARDQYWGARKVEGGYQGQNQLGNLIDQVANGARMNEMPPGTQFPSAEFMMGRDAVERAAAVAVDRKPAEIALPEPSIKASMYFDFGSQRRQGVESSSTFEAIQAGERTSTTRFPAWGGLERWEKLEPGSVARFYSDKEMRKDAVDVVVTGTTRVDLARMSDVDLEKWSKAEGWSKDAGRDFGRRYGAGVQIHYALPDSPEGREALGLAKGVQADRQSRSVEPERAASVAPQRPSSSQLAAMSGKERSLAAFGV